jgi:hypothetical protein
MVKLIFRFLSSNHKPFMPNLIDYCTKEITRTNGEIISTTGRQ